MQSTKRAHQPELYKEDKFLWGHIFTFTEYMSMWFHETGSSGKNEKTFTVADVLPFRGEVAWRLVLSLTGWSPSEILEAALWRLSNRIGREYFPEFQVYFEGDGYRVIYTMA